MWNCAMRAILIVDGNEHVGAMFAEIFASHGWAASWHSDGLQAAEQIHSGAHYDAVVLSNRLHSITGVNLIKRIRALEHCRDVAIVMVTGTTNVDVVAAALAAGADDVLYKPVDIATLVCAVNKCIESRRGPADR
jgi:DNA-binding response OmpR family regulator